MSKTNLTPANAYTYGGNLAMSLPDNLFVPPKIIGISQKENALN